MSLVWHIVKKDLRALRWFVAAYGMLLVCRLLLASRGVDVLFGFAHVILVAVGVAWLISEDPLHGAQARWVAMPIAPHRLRAAKIATVALLFWILPSVVHTVGQWLRSQEPAGSLPASLVGGLFLPAAALLVAMIAQGLPRFFIGFMAVLILPLVLGVRVFPFPGASLLTLGGNGMQDVWVEIVRRALFLGGFVCVVAAVAKYQFVARRGGRAEFLAALGLAALCLLVEGYAAVFG